MGWSVIRVGLAWGALKENKFTLLGAALPVDAIARPLLIADIAGVRSLAVHAKEDSPSAFYRHFGFVPSATDSRRPFMLIKDIRAAAGD